MARTVLQPWSCEPRLAHRATWWRSCAARAWSRSWRGPSAARWSRRAPRCACLVLGQVTGGAGATRAAGAQARVPPTLAGRVAQYTVEEEEFQDILDTASVVEKPGMVTDAEV
jgi:hypothetical protein